MAQIKSSAETCMGFGLYLDSVSAKCALPVQVSFSEVANVDRFIDTLIQAFILLLANKCKGLHKM